MESIMDNIWIVGFGGGILLLITAGMEGIQYGLWFVGIGMMILGFHFSWSNVCKDPFKKGWKFPKPPRHLFVLWGSILLLSAFYLLWIKHGYIPVLVVSTWLAVVVTIAIIIVKLFNRQERHRIK